MILYWDVIFYLGLMESFVKLKMIIRNQNRLKSLESYDFTNLERSQRLLKDLNNFGRVKS